MACATHRNSKARDFYFCARGRQITQTREDKSTDRVDSLRVDLKTEIFAYIVKARIAANKKSSVPEWLDIKSDIVAVAPHREEFLP